MAISHAYASSARLLPIKFILLMVQVILLVLVVLERENHVYFQVGQYYTETSEEYQSAENTLVGLSYTMIGMCFFEFLMMIVGTSVVPIFAKFNLLQIILHLLGSLFTLWFILDSWRYDVIWPIFFSFAILPLLVELGILQQSIRLKKDITRTRDGVLKISK